MFGYTDLMPPPCGLAWGMSAAECLAALGTPVPRQGSNWIEVELPLGGGLYETRLWADERSGLHEIQVELGISPANRADAESDGMPGPIRAEYEERYRRSIEEISGVLGAPEGSFLPDPDDPLYEVGGGLTYWDQPTGRVELALYHEGKYAPFELYLKYTSDLTPL